MRSASRRCHRFLHFVAHEAAQVLDRWGLGMTTPQSLLLRADEVIR